MQTGVYRMDNNKVPLFSIGNCFQYPVRNQNGKEYKKECICTYKSGSFCCTPVISTRL